MTRSVTPVGEIPVGACIPWMSPTLGAPQPDLPAGWEYADGGAVSTLGSLILGLNKPALMKTVENTGTTASFIKGADTGTAYGGATALVSGGASTHTHTGNTSTDGSHAHTGAVASGGATTSSTESSNQGALDLSSITGGSDTVALSHDHTVGSHVHAISSDGDHNHTLNIVAGSSQPPFVEMAWIIRVL
tara:strand:+ start:13103 stop:13672 length:570 start_codon:yes stop_codon:yes gene_type:complete